MFMLIDYLSLQLKCVNKLLLSVREIFGFLHDEAWMLLAKNTVAYFDYLFVKFLFAFKF